MLRKILVARSVSGGADSHGRQGSEFGGERGGDSCSGGRGQLQARSTRVDWFSCEQRRGGRSWYGKNAVFGLNCSASDVNRRAVDRIHAQQVEAGARAHNVADGVHCSHLMEMDLGERNAVDLRFGLTQALEHGGGVLFDAFWSIGFAYQIDNVLQM